MIPQNPYEGLAPYDRHDQYKFFGRDHEKEVLLGRILAPKTTLLYAVIVVLSMREDFLAELSIFRGRVPELLRNGYRLQQLTWHQALDAIVKPVEQEAFSFDYESALLNVLLRELAERQQEPTENSHAAMLPRAFPAIDGAYLQIVCTELWCREHHRTENVIRKSTPAWRIMPEPCTCTIRQERPSR